MSFYKITLHGELIRETDGAYLVNINDTEEWVPKSQVEYDDDGAFEMPRWLARDKGFI